MYIQGPELGHMQMNIDVMSSECACTAGVVNTCMCTVVTSGGFYKINIGLPSVVSSWLAAISDEAPIVKLNLWIPNARCTP